MQKLRGGQLLAGGHRKRVHGLPRWYLSSQDRRVRLLELRCWKIQRRSQLVELRKLRGRPVRGLGQCHLVQYLRLRALPGCHGLDHVSNVCRRHVRFLGCRLDGMHEVRRRHLYRDKWRLKLLGLHGGPVLGRGRKCVLSLCCREIPGFNWRDQLHSLLRESVRRRRGLQKLQVVWAGPVFSGFDGCMPELRCRILRRLEGRHELHKLPGRHILRGRSNRLLKLRRRYLQSDHRRHTVRWLRGGQVLLRECFNELRELRGGHYFGRWNECVLRLPQNKRRV